MKKALWLLPVFIFFILMTMRPHADLDLGWHLRYGQHFFQTGEVLKDNTLSFVWSDYKWVQASWGYDLLVYQIFDHFGFLGLTLAASFFALLIFLLIIWPISRFGVFTLLFLAVVFLSQTPPLYFTGIRSQTPSTLFFAIAIVIGYAWLRPKSLSEDGAKSSHFVRTIQSRSIIFLPLLFLIWANMHGGFALGLIVLTIMWGLHGVLIFIKKIRKARFETISMQSWIQFGIALLFSFITPLLNPWGFRIYEETLKHSSNTNLTVITEWLSYVSYWQAEPLISAVLIALTLYIAWLRKKATDIPYIVAFLFVTYLGYSAIRFLINFGVMLVFYLASNITQVHWPKMFLQPKFILAAKILLVSVIVFDFFVFQRYFNAFNPQVLRFTWNDYCTLRMDCVEEITELMHQNPPKGNGYHPYNYGGYLSWRAPHIKTFVDGRMAAWEENGKTPPVVTGDEAFQSKSPVTYRMLDSEYHFSWAIVPRPSELEKYLDGLVATGQWERQFQNEYYGYYVKK